MGKIIPPIDRFMLRVRLENDCWVWTAFKKPDGYGIFCLHKGKNISAHRFSFMHHIGPIADDLEVDHLCNNRSCVNPAHLELVTHEENVRRAVERGGYKNNGQYVANMHKSKTHCPAGHPYSGDNLTFDSNSGGRRCKICSIEKSNKYRKKKQDKATE